MTLRKMLGVPFALLLAAATLSAVQDKPVDLSGTWTGTLTPGGGPGGPAHIELKHKGAEVTSVTFESVQGNGAVMRFDLKVVEGRLKGNVALERDGQKREGTIDVGRAK